MLTTYRPAGAQPTATTSAQSAQPSTTFRRDQDAAPPVRRDPALQQLLQELFPVQPDIDYEAVYDALYQLSSQPLDLNRATRDELTATYLFSDRQISALLSYRADYGRLLSVYELQAVPEFSVASIRRLLPFVTVSAGTLFDPLPPPVDHYVVARYERILEQRRGFSPAEPDRRGRLPTRYLGSPAQWYVRYRYARAGAFSLGLTLEKDAGEPFRWQPATRRYGFDYVSFHAQVQDRGRWRNVVVGDFQTQIGQGLVVSAGFVLGKNSETVQTVRRPTIGTRPYTSLTESGFFRGLSATYALTPNLDITLLASRIRRGANLRPDSTDGAVATSLLLSGLHRTPAELADRGSLLEQNLGAHLHYRPGRHLQLGATTLLTRFGQPLRRRDLPYNRFEFAGRQNVVVGVHGGYVRRNVNLFGEVARSSGSEQHSGGWGAVGGALVSWSRRIDMAVVARHYARNFHSFYANAFSEGTRTINETGLYVGGRYSIYRKLTVGAYVDYFRFPWLRFRVDRPSAGFDALVQLTYAPNRQLTLSGIWRVEHKAQNVPNRLSEIDAVVGTRRHNYVLNAEYRFSADRAQPGLSIRSRAQWGAFRYVGFAPSRGLTLVQDATYDWGRLSLSGRVAWFGTDDFDSRQYVYERDVPYAFSFPAYFERGTRHYVVAQYSLNRHVDVWVRWARTHLTNRPTIGSDLDLIAAPHRSEVTMQARWRF